MNKLTKENLKYNFYYSSSDNKLYRNIWDVKNELLNCVAMNVTGFNAELEIAEIEVEKIIELIRQGHIYKFKTRSEGFKYFNDGIVNGIRIRNELKKHLAD